MRKKIAACMVGFLSSPAGLPGASIGPTTTNADGRREESFRPGMMVYGQPGESATFFDPKPSPDYQPYNVVQLRAIAAGLGMPYELLTGDLSEVNYTSHRGGLVQFRGMVEADQWQIVIPQVVKPVWERFLEAASVIDSSIDTETQAVYTPPRFGLLDPAKEIPAILTALESGIDSYPNAIRREGYDWREKLDEIQEFQEEVARRGIRLTSVPADPAPVEPAPVAPEPEPEPKAKARMTSRRIKRDARGRIETVIEEVA
jgi:capsid protein